MDDLQIVQLYWQRDQSAIRESSAKYGRMLHSIAFGIISNHEDSEECVSDTYGKAWDTMPPQKPGSLAAYLGRITRNLSINRWHESHTQKRGRGQMLMELTDCVPTPQTVENEVERAALTELINGWLLSLPKEDRVLFLRRYWFGDEVQTLAKKLGASSNQMAGRLYRLRQKLKSVLEQEGISL